MQRVLRACGSVETSRCQPELTDHVAALACASPRASLDRRVQAALSRLELEPSVPLLDLAKSLGVSLDRLTHLVSEATGMPPRRHVLWQRLLRLVSAPKLTGNLAAAALDAGFSDHAHMTRTFRRFLGRAPSQHLPAPNVVRPWLPALHPSDR